MVGPPTNPPEPSPVQTHDHEFRPDGESPIIEDGAAIFTEYCDWVEITGSAHSERHDETFYETGAECEESRSYRMELAWFQEKSTGITYLGSEFDNFIRKAEEALISVEQGYGEIQSINPDKDWGYVTVESDDWRVKFKADCSPQIEPRPR